MAKHIKKILSMNNINKSFDNLSVLNDANLNLYEGKIMALIGENGAGKSTLIKILSGIIEFDDGNIELFGNKYVPSNVLESETLGIVLIHQELNLFDELSVLDNIFFASEIVKNKLIINRKKELEIVNSLFSQLNVSIKPDRLLKTLSIGEKQLVEIAKALRKNARILIMDEPTSALSDEEIKKIFDVLNKLKEKGVAIIYISHRLEEIYAICDDITILRDGNFIGEYEVSVLPQSRLIQLMVGRNINDPFPYVKSDLTNTCLEVTSISGDFVKDVSFQVKCGEIMGIGGLMGSGRTSLAHMLYGLQKYHQGYISLNGKILKIEHPSNAIKAKISYVSEDRKGDGLFINFSVVYNITITYLKFLEDKYFKIKNKDELDISKELMSITNVKSKTPFTIVSTLSGGNQQKVAIAKALINNPMVLILDEPTRGIDIASRREIYNLINSIKLKGTAVLLISSDMTELLALSDRILVMSEGRATGMLNFDDKGAENIMKLAVKNKGYNN